MKIKTVLFCTILNFCFAEEPNYQLIYNSWYTMQTGSTPWGYYNEVTELKGGKISQRQSLLKVERGKAFNENVGVLVQSDFTPITFNYSASHGETTESVNAVYKSHEKKIGGEFTINIQGARSAKIKKIAPKNTYFDVTLPLVIAARIDELKNKKTVSLNTFPVGTDYSNFSLNQYKIIYSGRDNSEKCEKFELLVDSTKSTLCLAPKGDPKYIKVGAVLIKKVDTEKAAKDFISGVLPK